MTKLHSPLSNDVYSITNYKFKNETLLSEVFKPTKNVTNQWSYERLEFLGDSVLNLVVSIILFELFPLESEGQLTLRKNDLVSGHRLSEVCQSLNLMRLFPETSVKSIWRESDTMEALIGAIFLDGGLANVKNFIDCHWKKLARKLNSAPVDAKTRLYIWAQKQKLPPPHYRVTDEFQDKGVFTVTLSLKNTHGYGTVKVVHEQKKRGEILAAEIMLDRIENREKWKVLLKSTGDYITEEDLIKSQEDFKTRLNLWCKAHEVPRPVFGMVGKTVDGKVKYTSSVILSDRVVHGISSNKTAAEKKTMLKAFLELCDDEKDSILLKNKRKSIEIDLCEPKNFKSLLAEWVTKRRVGPIKYEHESVDNLLNISLTILDSDLDTVCVTANNKRQGQQQAAAIMIGNIIEVYGLRTIADDNTEETEEILNYKKELSMWAQSRKLPTPEYKVVNVTGLRHNLLFTVSVNIQGQNTTIASGYTKQSAQQESARLMLEQINRNNVRK